MAVVAAADNFRIPEIPFSSIFGTEGCEKKPHEMEIPDREKHLG